METVAKPYGEPRRSIVIDHKANDNGEDTEESQAAQMEENGIEGNRKETGLAKVGGVVIVEGIVRGNKPGGKDEAKALQDAFGLLMGSPQVVSGVAKGKGEGFLPIKKTSRNIYPL